jgi:hypothetical protein
LTEACIAYLFLLVWSALVIRRDSPRLGVVEDDRARIASSF